jgi:hypothetical protein
LIEGEGEKAVPTGERLEAVRTFIAIVRSVSKGRIERGESVNKAEVEEAIKKLPQEMQEKLREISEKFGEKISRKDLLQVGAEISPDLRFWTELVRQEAAQESEREIKNLVNEREELKKQIEKLKLQPTQQPPASRPVPQKVGWSKRLGDWWENNVPDGIKAVLTLSGSMAGLGGIAWGWLSLMAFGPSLPAAAAVIGGVGMLYVSLRYGFGAWGPREREELREWAREELRRMVGPPPEAAPRAEIPPPQEKPEVEVQPVPSGPEAPTQAPPTAVSEAVPKEEVPPALDGK